MKEVHPALRTPPNTKFIQLRAVPEPVHKALKVKAVSEGSTLEQYITDVLSRHVGLAPF